MASAMAQETLPLLPQRMAAPVSSPLRDRLASFEGGFPTIVAEDQDMGIVTTGDAASVDKSRGTAWWPTLGVLLTLLMSAIGSGTLAVPYTLLLLSPVAAVVTIVLVGLAMAFTADTILRVHVAVVASSGQDLIRETYQELAFHAGGTRLAAAVSFLAGFAVFGACVGCVRVVTDMAPSLLAMVYAVDGQRFADLTTAHQDTLVARTVWLVFFAVVLPLGFFKKISVLRYSSYVGFVCCVYLVGAVAYRSVVGVDPDMLIRATQTLQPIIVHESAFSRLAVAIGIYNFTYMLHLNVIPLFAQVVTTACAPPSSTIAAVRAVDEPTARQHSSLPNVTTIGSAEAHMARQIYATAAICALLYAVFGVCAASLYGSHTQGNILLNLAQDPIMTVPRVVILFTILFSFPLLFHPLRCLVLELRWFHVYTHAHPAALATRVAVSVVLMVAQILVATRVPGIQVVFSFVGSSILLLLCYVLPTVFYARLYPWRSTRMGVLRMRLLVALACVATVFCSVATVKLIG